MEGLLPLCLNIVIDTCLQELLNYKIHRMVFQQKIYIYFMLLRKHIWRKDTKCKYTFGQISKIGFLSSSSSSNNINGLLFDSA